MNVAVRLLSGGAPGTAALRVGPLEVTYAELRWTVDHWARSLLARGGSWQDRVAILAENGPFFVAAYLAVIRAGMVAVPLPADSSAEAVSPILSSAGARLILASAQQLARVGRWGTDLGAMVVGEPELAAESVTHAPLPDTSPARDLAALMFTSGSTGKPKGVMISHQNIECNTRDIVRYLHLSPEDRVLAVLPFCYCFGLSLLHTHLAAGGSVVMCNESMYPERILQELDQQVCTGLAGVPSTFQILLRKSRLKTSIFPSLRWLQLAGGRLPNSCILEVVDALPAVRLFVMYGQTEATARLSYLPPERLRDKLGSIGSGLPSVKLEVLTPEGRLVTPGSDEIGEIVASGDSVGLGYWNDPEETAKYFRDGRLFTGDLARVDTDGFIYIVEREREMIKCRGNRVGAKEVEDVIAELSTIVEVAVVGAPHDILGEGIVAFVECSGQAGRRQPDVLEHCRRRLSSSRVPEAVVHVRRMPHLSNGKIAKAGLKEFAASLLSSAQTATVTSDVEQLRVLRIDWNRNRTASVREETGSVPSK